MNDPRITNYALGELDPTTREAFERELANSTNLQHELKETISLIEILPAIITMNETLTDSSRETLRSRARDNFQSTRQKQTHRHWMFVASIGAIAAGFAAAVILILSDSNPKSRGTIPEAASYSHTSAIALLANNEIATSKRSDSEPKESVLNRPNAGSFSQSNASKASKSGLLTMEEPTRRSESVLTEAPPSLNDAIAPLPAEKKKGSGNTTRNGDVELEETYIATATTVPKPMPASPASLGRSFQTEKTSGDFYKKDDKLSRDISDTRSRTDFNTEAYDAVAANAFLNAQDNPLSTFSIDVDTASYANVRRFLTAGQLPPAGAVRIEELINYFPYNYPQSESGAPFSVTTNVTRTPWNEKHWLARIALKGRDIAIDKLPASNLVFLIDVSGSMDEPNKLPLLKRSLAALIEKLSARDRVAIVVYAGSSGTALPSTPGEDKPRILEAIDRLEASGSTNGAEGIRLAYDIAREHFLKEGNNRIILCTDGDFNVGVTSRSELVRLIEHERKSGVFLSMLGFGTGNVKDASMEQLADKGNGNYAYIDTLAEGRKVLVEQMGATLFTIAKDVKIQVEFNPATVAGYRLIGYENRLLAKEDFNNDQKDAGEIGAGHTVTALYEIIPAGQSVPGSVDPLKYQLTKSATESASKTKEQSEDLFTVKLRYKAPDENTSKLIEKEVGPSVEDFEKSPEDFRFATAVAAFGMKLRGDEKDSTLDWNTIRKIARASLGEDPSAYRAEFLTLIEKAKQLSREEK